MYLVQSLSRSVECGVVIGGADQQQKLGLFFELEDVLRTVSVKTAYVRDTTVNGVHVNDPVVIVTGG